MTTTPLPPLDWVAMLKDASRVVKGKPTYKRFIDGTPLDNDVPVWMADFAVAQAEQARADLEAENKRLRDALNDAATSLETIQLRSYGEDSNLSTMLEVRGYAGNRAKVARAALENRS
ncbi:MAG TPA: hypothetical protein PLT54_11625 [Rhodoferax sp.]|nr:hypothetical protein [Rhodoferax sp.]